MCVLIRHKICDSLVEIKKFRNESKFKFLDTFPTFLLIYGPFGSRTRLSKICKYSMDI